MFLKLSVFLNPDKPNFPVYFSQPDHHFMLSLSTRVSFSLNFEVLNGSFDLRSMEEYIVSLLLHIRGLTAPTRSLVLSRVLLVTVKQFF